MIPKSKPPQVLIIDDDRMSVSLLVWILNQFGFEVITAYDGPEGFAKAQQTLPNMILLDIQMPTWDGFETCSCLKGCPETQAIPVIFLTTATALTDKIKGFQVGGVDYLTKPYHELDVLARIMTYLPIRQQDLYMLESSMVYEPTSSGHQTLHRNSMTSFVAWIYQAREFLLTHLQEPPSLKQLARTVGTNPNKLSKAFQQHFGMTVFDYLREQRLTKAQYLLHHTVFSIQHIADTIGYKNHSDFTVAFKRRFGLTPRQYRRQSRHG